MTDIGAQGPQPVPNRPHPLAAAFLLTLLAGAAPLAPGLVTPASAQPLDEAAGMLESDDPEEVEGGLQLLGMDGSPAAVPLLTARIRAGLPPALLSTAVMTLMAIGHPDAGPVLAELARHRRPEVRQAALEALGLIGGPRAEAALVAGLTDSHRDTRAAAATGLGQAGSAASIEILFKALERGNMAAAASIGQLVPPGDLGRLLDYLGKLPLTTLGPALTAVLTRKDIPKRARLQAVGRLQELATPEVKTYFGNLMAEHAAELPQAVSRAVIAAIGAIAE